TTCCDPCMTFPSISSRVTMAPLGGTDSVQAIAAGPALAVVSGSVRPGTGRQVLSGVLFQVAEFTEVMLGTLAGPAGPSGPCGPTAPATPAGPCGPAAPAGPAGPCGPVAPGAPAGPAGPIRPTAPAGPIGPASPGLPAGPCGPAGPASFQYRDVSPE